MYKRLLTFLLVFYIGCLSPVPSWSMTIEPEHVSCCSAQCTCGVVAETCCCDAFNEVAQSTYDELVLLACSPSQDAFRVIALTKAVPQDRSADGYNTPGCRVLNVDRCNFQVFPESESPPPKRFA